VSNGIATPPVEKTIAGFRAITQPLDHNRSSDLLPDVLELISPLAGAIAVGISTGLQRTDAAEKIGPILEPALSGLGRGLGAGRLKSLESRLLVATSVVVPTGPNGAMEHIDLGSDDNRNKAFTMRRMLWLGVMLWALEVNFKDFLSVGDLLGIAVPTASR
jgi:hypothetical protein